MAAADVIIADPETVVVVTGQQPGLFPLRFNPSGTAQGWLIGAGYVIGQFAPLGDLQGKGRFADLPCSRDDLNESPGFF